VYFNVKEWIKMAEIDLFFKARCSNPHCFTRTTVADVVLELPEHGDTPLETWLVSDNLPAHRV